MDAIEQLTLFRGRAEELQSLRLVANGLRVNTHVSWEQGKEIEITNDGPEEEVLRSGLLTLRLFLLDKEPVFLPAIFNLCHQCVTNEEAKAALVQVREALKQARKGRINFISDGRTITAESAADLYIHGKYFHSHNLDKRAELEAYVPSVKEMIRGMFLSYVVDVCDIIRFVDSVIKWVLEHQEVINIPDTFKQRKVG